MKKIVYLAGPLFTAGERLHLLYLERYLREFGYDVVQPMVEALRFVRDGRLDLAAMREHLRMLCRAPDHIVVCCLDGSDVDSGTAQEYAVALEATGRVVTYRTDFRTDEAKEVGLNGMFSTDPDEYLFLPCAVKGLDDVGRYYRQLASGINDRIVALTEEERS